MNARGDHKAEKSEHLSGIIARRRKLPLPTVVQISKTTYQCSSWLWPIMTCNTFWAII
jgi:hypothetical protein